MKLLQVLSPTLKKELRRKWRKTGIETAEDSHEEDMENMDELDNGTADDDEFENDGRRRI